MTPATVGARAEILAAAWLLQQGYEVYRNVSFFGPIDTIAIKGKTILRIDVKTAAINRRGRYSNKKLNKRHIGMGIKLLYVLKDGRCSFDPEEVHRWIYPRRSQHRSPVR